MEGESSVRGKRKAGSSSPLRESNENQSTSIVTIENDRKRRGTSIHDDPVPCVASDSPSADEDEVGDGDDPSTSHDSDDDEGERKYPEDSMEDDLQNYGEYSDHTDDDGPQECKVEERETGLGEAFDGQVTMKVYLQEDDDEFESWMRTIHVRCSYDGKEIGRGFGRYVKRDCIRPNFWRDMEEPCHELSTVAFQLFDRYGCLRREFIDHIVRKGTGCWGSELDHGSLFIIEYMSVEKLWRRKGVGKSMTTSLISKACAGGRSPAFTIVIPGWLNGDIREDINGKTNRQQREIRGRARDAAIYFYRLFGFRRIGASCCFGLACDPNHQAHQIAVGADFDPSEEEAEEDDPEGTENVEENSDDFFGDPDRSLRGLKLLQDCFPLHHASITLSDSACVEFFKKVEISGEVWTKVDRFRKNILHLAACEFKLKSVQWLLENADHGQRLSSARNIEGYTPLEELKSQLDSKRTTLEHGMMKICMSDKFRGFPAEAILCLAALEGNKALTRIQSLQLKFGCTCGECIDGFLSPRMKFALLCQAEICHDMSNDEVDDGALWCSIQEDMIVHVAPDIQRNFRTNKSLRQGFSNIFLHAAMALRANTSPGIANVLHAWRTSSEWPPVTRNFYARGGSTGSALRIIFENAREQDQWAGDGTNMDTFHNDVTTLPHCRNDHEFGFAALACGVLDL